MDDLNEFYGPNAGYVLELYERYQRDPQSVDEHTRALFDGWSPADLLSATTGHPAPTNGRAETTAPVEGGAELSEAPARDAHAPLTDRPLGLTGIPSATQDVGRVVGAA